MTVNIEAGDVFLTRGHSWLSKAIRFFTRSIGESRTQVNHVGVVVEPGDLKTCVEVEALIKVRRHRLWAQYGPPKRDSVAIYRPINLTEAEIAKVVESANRQVGKKYGFLKLLAHLLDWLLLGAYVFRRIARNGKYPICSWLVAHAFAAAGKDFGVAAGMADPDHIWDFVNTKKDKYKEVHSLKPIWEAGEQEQG